MRHAAVPAHVENVPAPPASTGPAATGPAGARSEQPRVFVVGSVNDDTNISVDRLPTAGETVLGSRVWSSPGGKGANQAVAAARAGARVVLAAAVGTDARGESSLRDLQAEGVDTHDVLRTPDAPTGHAFVVVADHGENQIVVVPGANFLLSADDVDRAMDGIGPGDVCLISFEIPEPAVLAAASAAARAGATLLVNPAPARPLPDALLACAPILLPNASEAETLSGRTGENAARWLAEQTGRPVVVTVGADGVVLVEDGRIRAIPAVATEVMDTSGAGDTFAGVLAQGLSAGRPLEDAARRAVVAAGLSVGVEGARTGIPTAAAIEAELRRTQPGAGPGVRRSDR